MRRETSSQFNTTMGQKGHGTVINGADAQGDARVFVSNNGDGTHYESNTELTIVNSTGQNIEPGQVVYLDYDGSNVVADGMASRAVGDVSSDGVNFTVTDPGNTDLSGTTKVSTTHGNNDGYGGATGITAGNINGEAAYLE